MSATLFASFAAAKIKAFQATKLFRQGGYEVLSGGSHASGKDIPLGFTSDGRQRRAEGGEGMAIFNRRSTSKYGSLIPDLVSAINRGDFENKYRGMIDASASLPMVTNSVHVNTGKMEKELVGIRRLLGGREVYLNESGERVEVIGNRRVIYRKS